jgi:hypothetical protein
MEPDYEEKAGAQESTRGGAWQVGRVGTQRGQTAGQPRKRSQGRLGQKPQEGPRRAAQRPPTPSGSSQEVLSTIIVLIQARFGDVAIGLGERGIRYRAVAAR